MPVFSRFLRYFMMVGRYGSLRRAAEELHVSASAIDRQILQAEAQLGVALFERQPTGLRLTAAGEILMSAGAQWEKGLVTVRSQLEDLRGLRRGHVEIAVIDALAGDFVPELMRKVHDEYPGITASIRVLDNAKVRDAILEGRVDFGTYLEPQSYRDLVVQANCPATLGFVTLPGHPLARSGACRFSASIGHRLVIPAPPLAVAEQLAILQGTTNMVLDVAASSDNIVTVKSLVAEGLGIGVLTSLDVVAEVRRGDLCFVEIADPILRPMTLALCTASSRTLSSAANLLLAEAQTVFAKLAPRTDGSGDTRSGSGLRLR